MTLLTTKVPRSLETKAKLFGFELGDLLIVFLYLALSNLIFGGLGGGARLKFIFVWLGTATVAGVLYFTKKGRPENFLQHYGEHLRAPGVLSAGAVDTEYRPYLKTALSQNTDGGKSNVAC